MTRHMVVVALLTLVVVGVVSGQSQPPPATLDDLLTEIRGMRGDINRAASASVRAELLTARVTLQELRLSTAGQQLANVRQQLAESRLRLAPSTEQIKPAMETNSQILAPLRYTVQQEQQRDRVLQNEEAALTRLIEGEESRWADSTHGWTSWSEHSHDSSRSNGATLSTHPSRLVDRRPRSSLDAGGDRPRAPRCPCGRRYRRCAGDVHSPLAVQPHNGCFR